MISHALLLGVFFWVPLLHSAVGVFPNYTSGESAVALWALIFLLLFVEIAGGDSSSPSSIVTTNIPATVLWPLPPIFDTVLVYTVQRIASTPLQGNYYEKSGHASNSSYGYNRQVIEGIEGSSPSFLTYDGGGFMGWDGWECTERLMAARK